MNLIIAQLLSLLTFFNTDSSSDNSCFCYTDAYCRYAEDFSEKHPTLVAFKGSFIQTGPSGFSNVLQFKVDKKYFGEIVTEDSPYYDGETFINTDSTVWIASGTDADCSRYIYQMDAIFIMA